MRATHRSRTHRLAIVLACLALVMGTAAAARAADGTVSVLRATGVVDPVMASYIAEGVAKAQREGSAAVVIELDTPGGSLEATNAIVSTLLEAPLPTIVWVAPAGGRAASAGTFITLAAAVAAMAPGTSIGAASPVGSGGEDLTGTIGAKVRNDAVAKITAIAEERGRDVAWARSTVTDARSSPASEAAAVGAVDFVAASLDEVLRKASGMTVRVAGEDVTLDLVGSSAADLPMNPLQQLIHVLSDPNIALILFTLGFYGLVFELQSPNFVTGILGALAIILAFVGAGSLPLQLAGVLLIGLSAVLLLLEATVTSHGLLAVGAVVAFVLGAATLYTEPGSPTLPAVTVSWPIVAMLAAVGVAMALLVGRAAFLTRRMPRVAIGTGSTGPVDAAVDPSGVAPGAGTEAVVRTALVPVGSVLAAGEEWSAVAAEGLSLERGARVRVVGRAGLRLVVEPLDAAAPPGASSPDTASTLASRP
jgi:membrane-bound serine protease (ClpP class)